MMEPADIKNEKTINDGQLDKLTNIIEHATQKAMYRGILIGLYSSLMIYLLVRILVTP